MHLLRPTLSELEQMLCIGTTQPHWSDIAFWIALTYLKTLRSIHPKVASPVFMTAFHNIQLLENITPKDRAAIIPPSLVSTMIGDLTTQPQIQTFQLWVSASRFDDSKKWGVRIHRKQRTIELFFDEMKGDSLASRHFSKFIPFSGTSDQMIQLWQRPSITYDCFATWLRTWRCPGLTPHSLRNSAIHFLEDSFPQHEVVLLTGHKQKIQIPGIQSYWRPKPEEPSALLCRNISAQLILALGS
jgi:hypothetical protein